MAGTHNPGTGEPETGGSLRLAGLLCLVSFKPIRDPVSKKKIKIKGWAGFRVPELINQASVAAACNPSTGGADRNHGENWLAGRAGISQLWVQLKT